MSAISILTFVLIIIATPLKAQLDNAGEILRAGQEDANTLLKEYFKPVGKGFGTDLNTGWFNTAKTHGTLGFDISINASVARVPGVDRSFDVRNIDLDELEYIEGDPITPTAFGGDESGPTMGAYEDYDPTSPGEELVFDFEMPRGTGVPYVPAPMVQAGVGLIKGTDITARYVPPLSLPSDIKLNLWGVGIKHEITQWLPGGQLIPVDLSLQAGFTKLNSSVGFTVNPEEGADIENNYPDNTWNGQKAELSSDAFTINALIGKTLPFISVYGGFGYETSAVNLSTPGSYPITVPNEDYPEQSAQSKEVEKIDNPIDLSYSGNSSFRGLIGTRIKLAFFNITASYTLSKYPVGQVGVGFSFR